MPSPRAPLHTGESSEDVPRAPSRQSSGLSHQSSKSSILQEDTPIEQFLDAVRLSKFAHSFTQNGCALVSDLIHAEQEDIDMFTKDMNNLERKRLKRKIDELKQP